jgi:hypothetical protein
MVISIERRSETLVSRKPPESSGDSQGDGHTRRIAH